MQERSTKEDTALYLLRDRSCHDIQAQPCTLYSTHHVRKSSLEGPKSHRRPQEETPPGPCQTRWRQYLVFTSGLRQGQKRVQIKSNFTQPFLLLPHFSWESMMHRLL